MSSEPAVQEPFESDLSEAQRAIWLDQSFAPDSVAYHISAAVRILEPVDLHRLRQAIQSVLDTNPLLRATFHEVDGEPVQRIADASIVDLEMIDATDWSDVDVDDHLRRHHLRPFDLETGPPVRFTVLTRGTADHVLSFCLHHLVTDLWSNALLGYRIATAYNELETAATAAAPRRSSYAKHVERERRTLSSPRAEDAVNFWRQRVGHYEPAPAPCDRNRPPDPVGIGALCDVELSQASASALHDSAQRHGVSLRAVVLAAYQVVLHRHTHADQVIVAEALAHRNLRTAQTIGCFINQVPRAATFSAGNTLHGVIRDLDDHVKASQRHESIPLPHIARQLGWPLSGLRPLETSFAWQKTSQRVDAEFASAMVTGQDGAIAEVDGLAAQPLVMPIRSSPSPLTLLAAPSDDTGLRLTFEYQPERFDRDTVETLARHLRRVCEAIVDNPDADIDLVGLADDDEQQRRAEEWRAVQRPIEELATHELVHRQALATPHAVAVRFGTERVTYEQLANRAQRRADELHGAGVRRGTLVGFCLDRTPEMIVSMLAVWKCGAGHVPMDPEFPANRLSAMAIDADVDLVVTSRDVWSRVEIDGVCPLFVDDAPHCESSVDDDSTSPEPTNTSPADVAYVIFTSGSSGRPKGVVVEHRNVVNFLEAMAERPGLSPSDSVLASTTLSFDISVLELLLPLTVGAEVVLVERSTVRDPLLLAAALDGVTVAQGTPTMWQMLLDAGWTGSPDLTVLCGGEALLGTLATGLLECCGALWNMYGPTETTVWSAVGHISPSETDRPPIGRAIDNTSLLVLDADGRPVPDGIDGELYIGGAGVARGYINRPELTEQRFLDDPHTPGGGRMYRTGDLVRRRANGRIDFLGRVDEQIKLRGHRIELGEIESAVRSIPGVTGAAATVHDVSTGDQRLVAYYTAEPSTSIDGARVRASLRSTLPAYMVPAAVERIDEIPTTPNEKIDRNRLPRHIVSARSAAREPPAPDEIVDAIVDIFRTVLGDDQLSTDGDFFVAGGHSLLATKIVSRVRTRLQRDIAVRDVFEHPTAADLAAVVALAPVTRIEPLDSAAEHDRREFSPSHAQERMWLVHQFRPDSSAYHVGGAIRIGALVNEGALRHAFDRLIERHSSLRTTFRHDDVGLRSIVGEPFSVAIDTVDLRSHTEDGREAALQRHLHRFMARPIDLATGPLLRSAVYRLEDDRSVIALVVHHIVADQWALGLLAHELALLYIGATTGDTPELPDAPHAESYGEWQRQAIESGSLDEHLAYWRRQLAELPIVEVPTDRPRPAMATMSAGTTRRHLPDELIERVRDAAHAEQASEFMLLLAALAVLVHDETGATDLPIGVPIAHRDHLASEPVITSLVNTVVMRLDLSTSDTFGELLTNVRSTALDAFAHGDAPFDRVVDELAGRRDLGRSPLFQLFFNVLNAPFDLPPTGDVDLAVFPIERPTAQFDISISVDTQLTKTVSIEYATELYDRSTIERLLDRYVALLEQLSIATPMPSGARIADLPDTAADRRSAVSSAVDDSDGRSAPGAEGRQLEGLVIDAWETALGRDGIRRNDNFFDVGGDSLAAVRVFATIHESTGRRPPLTTLFSAPTVAELARLLDDDGWMTPWTSLVEVRSAGLRPPLFYVSPFLISALSLHDLSNELGDDVPFYILQPSGLDDDDPIHHAVQDMAAHYIRELKTVQPVGPYTLGGHCAGGWVAFEMARQLQTAGDHVEHLVVVDVEPPGVTPPRIKPLRYVVSRLALYGGSGRILDAVRWRFRRFLGRSTRSHMVEGDDTRAVAVRAAHHAAHRRYRGGHFDGDLHLVRSQEWSRLQDKDWHLEWERLASGTLHVDVVSGSHAELLSNDSVIDLGQAFRRILKVR